MIDTDTLLKRVAADLVATPPAPPPFPQFRTSTTRPRRTRRWVWRLAPLALAGALVLAVVGATQRSATQVDVSGDGTPSTFRDASRDSDGVVLAGSGSPADVTQEVVLAVFGRVVQFSELPNDPNNLDADRLTHRVVVAVDAKGTRIVAVLSVVGPSRWQLVELWTDEMGAKVEGESNTLEITSRAAGTITIRRVLSRDEPDRTLVANATVSPNEPVTVSLAAQAWVATEFVTADDRYLLDLRPILPDACRRAVDPVATRSECVPVLR